MKLCGTVVLLASALASCRAFTGVRPLVVPRAPAAHARLRHVSSSSDPLGSGSTRARATGPAPDVVRFSSPFEDVEHGDNDDEVDVMQREAEQLEAMIRGSRGIVVEAIEREWREEMLRVLGEEGEMLCSLAYEGYLDRGRGVIFVSLSSGQVVYCGSQGIDFFQRETLQTDVMVVCLELRPLLSTVHQHTMQRRTVSVS